MIAPNAQGEYDIPAQNEPHHTAVRASPNGGEEKYALPAFVSYRRSKPTRYERWLSELRQFTYIEIQPDNIFSKAAAAMRNLFRC